MIYISIGSNLGNRLNNIQKALVLLKKSGFHLVKKSPIVETEALLLEGSPASWNKPYFNMVIAGTCNCSIDLLLKQLKTIEQMIGREEIHEKWSPRTLDFDILLVDEQIINQPDLTVPHPELLKRPFLIHLLALITPNMRHPQTQQTFTEIAYPLKDITQCYLRNLVAYPQLVGIVNVTPDSFSDGSRYFGVEQAVAKVLQLHEEGASVIDLGAQATSAGAKIISPDEECRRLTPVLDALISSIQEKELNICIDSFSAKTILTLLEHYPIGWISDVKGALDDACLSKIAAQGCKFVATHSVSIPASSREEIISFQTSPIEIILAWAEKKIAHLKQCGFSEENIILDPGIGYGKTLYQNIALLQDVAQLKQFGCPVFIGHSRKLLLSLFTQKPPAERDLETIALSDYLTHLDIDYLRVHNVADHQRFLVAKTLWRNE